MIGLRRHPAATYAALKATTRQLIESLGGFEAAAGFTRVGFPTLHKYVAPQHEDAFAPIDVIADLESVDGNPIVTTVLGRVTRHQLLSLDPAGEGCEARAVAEVLRDAAELAASWAMAMGDARISDAERSAILGRLAELRRATDRASAMLSGSVTTAGQRSLGMIA
jgi:hypothetical protein